MTNTNSKQDNSDPQVKTETTKMSLLDIRIKNQEAEELREAQLVEEEIFGSEENAEKTAETIQTFVQSYEASKHEKTLEVWLVGEFQSYPELWKDQEEIVGTAREIIDTVTYSNRQKEEYYQYIASGKSKESYLAQKIEEGVRAANINNLGNHMEQIDQAVAQATDRLTGTVTNIDGTISKNSHLHGFIAEAHHVNSFNMEAAAQGSSLRAEMLQNKTKNSVDIVIKDGTKIVKRYQSKFGETAEHTKNGYNRGDYRGQGKVVPAGQEEGFSKAYCYIDANGVRSKPMTHEEAKKLQELAQIEGEIKKYQWDDISKKALAKGLAKDLGIAVAVNTAFQGGRILARRVWNKITGKKNPPVSEDLKEFFNSSIQGGKSIGIQTAIAGGVVIAAKKGFIKVLKDTPAGKIAQWVYVGLENAKVVYKVAKGEMSLVEGLDAMGHLTTSIVGGVLGASAGAAIGGTAGLILGVLGSLILPGVGTVGGAFVGSMIGEFVGGVAGGMAGSAVAEKVYQGAKAVGRAAANVVKSAATAVSNFTSSVATTVSNFTSSVASTVSSAFSSVSSFVSSIFS